MPTSAGDRDWLLTCGGLVVVGLALLAIGYWLDPVRVARHWWRNR